MRIRFCGADRTVTGSCHLIEVNGRRIFLDMGIYQGPRDESRRINQWLPDGAKSVDALMNGRIVDEATIAAAARATAASLDPPDDLHADAEYSRALTATLLERALRAHRQSGSR